METSEAEERVQFMLRLRSRGINDLRLLRALERAPRALFMPQRYADVAWRDMAMPIGCGQTAPPPSILAAMIQALSPGPEDRVLEIGTGTGYAAALLAQLAAEVVSLERHPSLALEAAARLEAFGLDNVSAQWGDGLALDRAQAQYDRILVHALIEPPAPKLTELLAEGGALVAAVVDDSSGSQRIVRLARGAEGQIEAELHGPARTLTPLAEGLARAL
ncbi:MAG TPA: methyltransferase domain-containing protein [Roseiarcus sp.]